MENSHEPFMLLSQHEGGPEIWGLGNIEVTLVFTVQQFFVAAAVHHLFCALARWAQK